MPMESIQILIADLATRGTRLDCYTPDLIECNLIAGAIVKVRRNRGGRKVWQLILIPMPR